MWERDAALLAVTYIEAIQRAGGMAVMIPPDGALRGGPRQMLDLLDGLILAGGNDIDPACYGADRHPETHHLVPERDRAELALATRAVERDIPVLGICRGMQLLNVAFGGTLRQHLPEELGHEEHRRTPGSFDGSDHDVRLTAGLARRARRRRGAARAPSPITTRASPPSATASRSPAARRSTTCPRRSRRPAGGSCSASSGIPRPTSRAASSPRSSSRPRDYRSVARLVVPGRADRLGHALGVGLTARLEHELHRGLPHVQVEPFADVLDVEQVRALLADEREQPRE